VCARSTEHRACARACTRVAVAFVVVLVLVVGLVVVSSARWRSTLALFRYYTPLATK